MESFVRRLKYYGIGFGIGLVFVFFFFQNRGCSWLPSNRVKNSILERVLIVSEEQEAFLKARKLTKKDIVNALNNGDVAFGKSRKQGDLKVYQIDFVKGQKNHTIYFTLPKESFVSEINLSAKSAHKVKTTELGTGKVLRYPNEKNLIFVDSSDVLSCQKQEMNFKDDAAIFKNWKKSAKINFEKSQLSLSPKPEHYFEFLDNNGNTVGSKSIWYKNKIDISDFDLPFESKCQ